MYILYICSYSKHEQKTLCVLHMYIHVLVYMYINVEEYISTKVQAYVHIHPLS